MRETTYRTVNVLGRAALHALGTRTAWRGTEHLPREGPVLLLANHVGFLDFLVVEQAALSRGRYVRFLCRHDVWDVPFVGGAMDRMRHVPVDRAAPAGAYVSARRLLREGEAVGIFPEAGVSRSFTVRALMRGAAALSRETDAAVVPVAVWGTQRTWTAGSRPDLTRGRRVDVLLGAPLPPAGDDLTAWTRHLGDVLTGQLEHLQRLPHHQPRSGERAPWHPAHLGGHAPSAAEAARVESVPRSAVRPPWRSGSPTRPGSDVRCDVTPPSPAGW